MLTVIFLRILLGKILLLNKRNDKKKKTRFITTSKPATVDATYVVGGAQSPVVFYFKKHSYLPRACPMRKRYFPRHCNCTTGNLRNIKNKKKKIEHTARVFLLFFAFQILLK